MDETYKTGIKQLFIVLQKSCIDKETCIIGKCGKKNLLMNLLLQDYLDYNNLYIFLTILYQPLHQILINGLKNELIKKEISECILKQKFTIDKKENSQIQVHCFDNYECVPNPKKIDSNMKTLILFDDIMLEKQNKVENYYTRITLIVFILIKIISNFQRIRSEKTQIS